jgi:cellulose biosynthesis protein BcsQ
VVFTVNAADLNTVDFQSVSGTETLYVRANDGTAADPNWGAWATTTINGAAKTQLPVVTAEAKTLTASRDQIFLYSSGLFTAAEPSSSPYAAISQYDLLVSDAAGGVGSWLVNGTAIANDVVFAVSAATIDTVSFQSVSGTETVYVRANDGTAADPNWGAWATIKVNGAAKTQLPVVTVLSKTVSAAQDQIIGYSSMFGITTDASTSIYASVSQYDFLVADSAGGVGSLLVGGTAQANDVVIAVNASDLGTVSFESVSGTETIYVRANDGTAADPNWGGWVSTTIKGATQHPGPVFTAINAKITTVQGGETVATPVTTFFNEIDAGGYPLAQYQVIDAAGAGSVGNFLVNGVAKANGAAVTVNASDLSTLSYKFQSGSQVLWIRANDGTAADPNWGAWASVTVTTPALTPSASPASHLPPLSASAVIPPLSSAATSIVSPAAMLTATSSSPAPLFALHNL